MQVMLSNHMGGEQTWISYVQQQSSPRGSSLLVGLEAWWWQSWKVDGTQLTMLIALPYHIYKFSALVCVFSLHCSNSSKEFHPLKLRYLQGTVMPERPCFWVTTMPWGNPDLLFVPSLTKIKMFQKASSWRTYWNDWQGSRYVAVWFCSRQVESRDWLIWYVQMLLAC